MIGNAPVTPPVLAIYMGCVYAHSSQLADSMLWNVELDGVSQRKSPHTYN